MNDVLRFACPSCHAQLAADSDRAAQTASCPDCGQLLILPGGKVPSGQKVLRVKPAKPLSMPPANSVDPQPAVPPSSLLAVPEIVPDLDPGKSDTAAESVQVGKVSPESWSEPKIIKATKEDDFNPDAKPGAGSGSTTVIPNASGLGSFEAADNLASPALRETTDTAGSRTTAEARVGGTSSPSGSKKKSLAAVLLLALAAVGTGIYLNWAAVLSSILPGPPTQAKSASPKSSGGREASAKQAGVSPAKSAETTESASMAGTGTTSTGLSGFKNTVNPPPSPPVAPPAPPEFSASAALGGTSGPAAPAAPPVAPAPAPAAAPKTPLGRARLVLDSFLAAPDWQKRLEFSLNPEGIRDSMAAHFRDRADGPIPVEGVSLMSNDTVPGTTRSLYGFRVRIRDFHSDIPMAVEETDTGFLVDWPPFLETYEQLLRKFFEKPDSEPGNFRVVLRRKHYFGPAVPGQDSVRQAYSVESPMRDESWVVWIDLKSPVYTTKLVPQGAAEWDSESFVIVHLEWHGDEKQGRWASLTDVIADNWQMR